VPESARDITLAGTAKLPTSLFGYEPMTDLMSSKITSLSLIALIRVEIVDACAACPKDSDEVKSLKTLVQANMDKRLPMTDAVALCTLLDPSTKSLVNLAESAKEELLYAAVTERRVNEIGQVTGARPDDGDNDNSASAASTVGPSNQAPLSKKLKLVRKHTVVQNHSDSRIREEIKITCVTYPLRLTMIHYFFWKRGLYPSLQQAAKKNLTRSAASVPVENLFFCCRTYPKWKTFFAGTAPCQLADLYTLKL